MGYGNFVSTANFQVAGDMANEVSEANLIHFWNSHGPKNRKIRGDHGNWPKW